MSGQLSRPGITAELMEWVSMSASTEGRTQLIELRILEHVVKKLNRTVDAVRMGTWTSEDHLEELHGMLRFLCSATMYRSVAAVAQRENVVPSLVNILKLFERTGVVSPDDLNALTEQAGAVLANLAGGAAKTPNGGRPYDVIFEPPSPRGENPSLSRQTVTVLPMGFASANVGWQVWDSAILLGNFFMTEDGARLVPQDGHVLELGCGLAATGLLLAKQRRARRIILSDYVPAIVDNVRETIEANDCGDIAEAERLDWADFRPGEARSEKIRAMKGKFPLIIASDVVYGEEALLVPDVVRYCLAKGGVFIGVSAKQHYDLVPAFPGVAAKRLDEYKAALVNRALYTENLSGEEADHIIFTATVNNNDDE